MAQATVDTNTRRRDFLALTAAAATVVMAARPALASPPFYGAQCPSYPACNGGCGLGCTKEIEGSAHDDSALLTLEEQIFEQHELATAYDDEIIRLHPVWEVELKRLADEVDAGRSTLTGDERWARVCAMPEAIECGRLEHLQSAHYEKMDALIKEMWATPSHTPEGRRAKVLVLLVCIMGHKWTAIDKQTDYREQMARAALIEFVGGEPGAELREQFA